MPDNRLLLAATLFVVAHLFVPHSMSIECACQAVRAKADSFIRTEQLGNSHMMAMVYYFSMRMSAKPRFRIVYAALIAYISLNISLILSRL